MTTGDNIWYTLNTPTKDGYVFSMSVRGADKELKKYVLAQEGYEWLGTEYKCKPRPYPRTIQQYRKIRKNTTTLPSFQIDMITRPYKMACIPDTAEHRPFSLKYSGFLSNHTRFSLVNPSGL